MKISYCDLIRAEFQSYNEGSISEEERSKVEEHLKECEACRAEFGKINSDNDVVKNAETVSEVKKKGKKRKKKIIIVTTLVVVFITALMLFASLYEFQVEYEDIADKIVIEENGDDVRIIIKGYGQSSSQMYTNKDITTDSTNKIVNVARYVRFNTTLWKKYISGGEIVLFNSSHSYSEKTANINGSEVLCEI